MRLRSIAALVPLVAGCAGQAAPAPPPTPRATRTPDELLALAPAGTRSAVVVSARGLELADRALAWLAAQATRYPPVAPALDALRQQGATLLGLPALDRLAALGLGHDRGFARFTLAAGGVVVWPIADRAAFVAAFDGEPRGAVDVIRFDGAEWQCREDRGAYACATEAALLDQLGTGSLAGKPERAGARGDVELVSYGDVSVAAKDFGRPTRETYVTFGLEPGQVVVHGWVRGPREGLFGEIDAAPARSEAGQASGFLVLALPEPLTSRARALLPDLVAASIHDALHVAVPSGTEDLTAHVRFRDSTYLQNLVERCDVVPVPPPFALAHAGHEDGCAIAGPPSLAAATWRDGDTLWLGHRYRDAADATGPAPTAVGRELADGEWHLATWGRGVGLSVLRAAEGWSIGGLDAAQWSRSLAWFQELGVGVRLDGDVAHVTAVVRTVLANPPPVADAMSALVSRALAGEDVGAEVKALAAAHPSSPLAGDVAAGHVGLMVPAAALYLYAAVIAPAQVALANADDDRPEPAAGDLDSQDVLARKTVAPSAEVRHVLVGWKGSTRTLAHARSKADAAELATELAEQVRADPARMEGLMALHSDDPGARNGRTYVVTPDGGLVAPFRDLSLRLAIGEVGVVESQFGYHVILRVAPPPPDPLESLAVLARPPGTAEVQVQHILIGWKETARSGVAATASARTKAQADDLARELLAKVKAGGDMAALMKAHSDDLGSSSTGRAITIKPGFSSMPRFTDLALRLKVGEAGLVKTDHGWHVVKRVKPPAPDPLDSKAILARKPVTAQAKVKHILLGWKDVNAGDARGVARTRAELEALVKKTVARLKRGAAIEPLMQELSEDPGSSQSGTSYDASPDAPLVAPFKELSLRLNVGEVGVVKTQFGIHIIQRVE